MEVIQANLEVLHGHYTHQSTRKLRVWAGIPKAQAHGVYCFPPLGLMYIQAAIEKVNYIAEIVDPVVDDLDYPDVEEMLKKYPLDLVGISTYTHSLPDVQKTMNIVRKLNPNATVVLGGPHSCNVS